MHNLFEFHGQLISATAYQLALPGRLNSETFWWLRLSGKYCLLSVIAHTIELEGGLLIGTIRTIDFGHCLLIGTAHTIDLAGALLIGIVRTTDFGYCLLSGIARKIDLKGGLLIGMVRTIYLGGGLLIELSGQFVLEIVH